jgi:predicted RND superfamily exporter protein
VKHRFALIAILLLVIGISAAGLARLRFETDILEVLPKNLPSVEALKISQKHFDNDQQVVLLLSSAEDEEIFEEDVAEIVEKLREDLAPAEVLFKSGFEEDPASFAIALAQIWRYAPPADVEAMRARLLDADKLNAHLDAVKAEIRSSFDHERTTIAAHDPLGFLDHPAMRQLMESEMSFQSEDGKSWMVLIGNPHPTTDYHEHAEWLVRIRAAVDTWPGLDELGLEYGLTGSPVFNAEIGAGMEQDMSGTVMITTIAVILLFLLVQRHPGQLAMISLLMGLTFLITLGIGGWVFGTLNLASVGFAAILLGLVIDYAVVIARESIGEDSSPGTLRRKLAPAILWAAATTAIVFGLLMFSTFHGVRQLGGLIVIGLATGATVMLVFTPMFLGKFTSKPARHFLKAPFASRWIARSVIGVGMLFAAAVFLIKGEPGISFNFSMVQPSTSEASATFERIQESFPAWSERNLQMIAGADTWEGLREAALEADDRLAKLKADGVVLHYQWPLDLIPSKEFSDRNEAALKEIVEQRESLVAKLGESGFSETGIALDKLVLEALASPADDAEIGELAKHSLATSAGGRKFLSGTLMVTEEVTVANFPMLSPLSSDAFNVTGWGVIQAAILPSVKRDFHVIFLPATAVLMLTLLVVFRSVRDAAVSIAVLLTSLALVNAYVVLTGQAWNFLSGMAIPLIVGTGIDYSIHLVFALRRYDGDFNKVWNGVGKAICFCGVSTAIGFGSLLFASNEMLRSMGALCSLGVLLTTALSVLVVPGLWKRAGRSRRIRVFGHRLECEFHFQSQPEFHALPKQFEAPEIGVETAGDEETFVEVPVSIGACRDFLFRQLHEAAVVECHELGEPAPNRTSIRHLLELRVVIRIHATDRPDEIRADIHEKRGMHDFGIAEIPILVLVERVEPIEVAALELLVAHHDAFLDAFAAVVGADQGVGGVERVGAVIEALAVERIHESAGVAHGCPALARDLLGPIGQAFVIAVVVLDRLGVFEHHLADRVFQHVLQKPFAHFAIGWGCEKP